MEKTIRTAIFGTGFMGRVHLEALRRLQFVEVVAIAGRNIEAARRLGSGFSIVKGTADFRDILSDPAIDAIHICTPNALHFLMAKAALEGGKHVLCEKPLATRVAEAEELVALAEREGLFNCVCHNLRYYPMVQQMRRMREAGELGEILAVQGTYFQDWLLHETDWNWRVEAEAGGPSRCMADIGSHWFDMAEHVTGLRVNSLSADLQTFYKTRKRPKHSSETFSSKLSGTDMLGINLLGTKDYLDTPVDTEDYGGVIFSMGERTHGSMSVSQVAAGRKNRLSIEISGTRASVGWNQERPDELWIGRRDAANQLLLKDPPLLKPEARAYADLPGGHSEGYDDTFKQVFRRFYASISGAPISAAGGAHDFPTFVDGLRQLKIVSAALESNRTRSWVDVSEN